MCTLCFALTFFLMMSIVCFYLPKSLTMSTLCFIYQNPYQWVHYVSIYHIPWWWVHYVQDMETTGDFSRYGTLPKSTSLGALRLRGQYAASRSTHQRKGSLPSGAIHLDMNQGEEFGHWQNLWYVIVLIVVINSVVYFFEYVFLLNHLEDCNFITVSQILVYFYGFLWSHYCV